MSFDSKGMDHVRFGFAASHPAAKPNPTRKYDYRGPETRAHESVHIISFASKVMDGDPVLLLHG